MKIEMVQVYIYIVYIYIYTDHENRITLAILAPGYDHLVVQNEKELAQTYPCHPKKVWHMFQKSDFGSNLLR